MTNSNYILYILIALISLSLSLGCKTEKNNGGSNPDQAIEPAVITDATLTDTDDPAIWIHPENSGSSLIIGTDKDPENGGLYAFDLNGKIQQTHLGLKTANNVDVAYGLNLNGQEVDIAVATERYEHRLRVFSLPDLAPIDGGGIPVFEDEEDDDYRQAMGIALYTRPSDQAIFAIVSRKKGPEEGYLEQYLLQSNENGQVTGELVRTFGKYSGKKEIEAIAVDDKLGYVYYADEQAGIRKYFANPEKGNQELAFFGQGDFEKDQEGIAIYEVTDNTGYIIVSDQEANLFNVYPREGTENAPHNHKKINSFELSTNRTDGIEVTDQTLPDFPYGMFVAMSDDKTFHYYNWQELAERFGLEIKEND
ncbi:MAG TPA: phytase [Flavobacteriaceae bacterium]|nr:phytase [Flavobacteriaceae bacterium]